MSSEYSGATGGNFTPGQTQVNNVGSIGAVLALVAGALMFVYIIISWINWSFFEWSLIPVAILSILGGALYMAGKRSPLPWLVLAAIVVSLLPINGGQITVYSIPGLGIFRTLADFGEWGFFNGIGMLFFWVGYLLLFVAFVLGLIAFIQRDRTPLQVSQVSGTAKQQVATQQRFANDGTAMAGWFPDPQGNPAERFWDGQGWTEQTRPQSQQSAVFAPPNASGQVTVDSSGNPVSPNSRLVALLLCFFLGGLGIHRFYVGKVGTGVAMIFTLGGLGIWALIDLIMIAVGSFRDKSNRLLLNW